MNEKVLFGDIHGQFYSYSKLINQFKDYETIQLGDMGIGFGYKFDIWDNEFPFDKKHKFIRGNHDNPEVCKRHKNYLGDYGITNEGIFYVGGGFSIDKEFRTEGKDWWYDEEISIFEFNKVLELYEKEKPEIIISHAQPCEVISQLKFNLYDNRTQRYFSEMFRIHQPKKWISAHLHLNSNMTINNTNFIVLDSLTYHILEF